MFRTGILVVLVEGLIFAIPYQSVPVTAFHNLVDGLSIEGPRVHVRVETFVGNGAEEEGFACFPGGACIEPGFCYGTELCVGAVVAEGDDCVVEVCVLAYQVGISRQDDGINILVDDCIILAVVDYDVVVAARLVVLVVATRCNGKSHQCERACKD